MAHKCSDELKMELTGEVVHFMPIGGVTDTSDTTAQAEHIEEGKTAYSQGRKVTGTLTMAAQLSNTATAVEEQSIRKWVDIKGNPGAKCIVDTETEMKLSAALSEFGDATAADVAAGKSFTSADGLRVTGTHEEVDTSDATAAAEDMAEGVTAYVNGEKVTGTLTKAAQISGAASVVTKHSISGNVVVKGKPSGRYIVDTDTEVSWTASKTSFGDAAAADVAKGKTFTSSAGLLVTGTHECEGGIDTTDATATAVDMLAGATAYVNGEKIEGTLAEVPSGSSLPGNTEQHVYEVSDQIAAQGVLAGEAVGDGVVVRPGANIVVRVPKSEFGNATASDVAAGKTFTSASGLKAEGSLEEATILAKTGGSLGFNLNNNGVVVSATQDTDVLLRGGSQVSVTASYDKFGDATAADVAKGKKFTSASGLLVTGTHECEGGIDTTDATATAADMLAGATAYVNGEKIEGTLVEIPAGQSVIGNQNATVLTAGEYIVSKAEITSTLEDFSGAVVRPNAMAAVRVPKGQFGDAAASDVAAGKTFTSAAGLLVVGTGAVGGGVTVTDDGEGNVVITSASATDDGSGNVAI